MSLPDFLGRVHDAAGPLLGGIAESELGRRLDGVSVVLEIDSGPAEDPGQRAGYLLAVNLASRLYPHLGFDAPDDLIEEAVDLARRINPKCEFGPARSSDRTLSLSWCGGDPQGDRITVAAEGWGLSLDGNKATAAMAVAPAAMAAAALGVGELFRALFADLLEHGRTEPSPFELNLLGLEPNGESLPLPESVELGEVHLAGCGAIGQAAVAALRELPVSGTLFAVDHDALDEGNLQRYVLAYAADPGTPKPLLIDHALADHALAVVPVPTLWGADERSAPGRETVLSALDSKQGRIELQAGLPRELFNAWTQPEDIGVSRHQGFGSEPCLACLAWPDRPRPSESQMIAEALGEHELRVIHYLGSGLQVGAPLPAGMVQGTVRLPLPEQAAGWAERSLLEDLIERYDLPRPEFEQFAGVGVGALYRGAACGSMLVTLAGIERAADLSVPLAHQSALAGILLATWLLIDRVPELRELRPAATQARYDVLRGGALIWPRSRDREPRCLCHDGDFLEAYRSRWGAKDLR